MVEKLVTIYKSEPRISSLLIAEGFNRRHEYVTRLIKRYQERFERFKPLVVVKKIRGRGKPFDEYLLTEAQFMFLGTIFKNSEIVLDFKEKLVQEFDKVRRQLAAVKNRQSDTEWLTTRDLGKNQRLRLTDTIKDFVEHAKEQGSKNADKYYMIISRMTNSLLFIFQGDYQNARNLLTPEQLITLASAERIISKGLKDGMKAKTFYKDIYQSIKTNVLAFAEMHGKSDVIEEQLKLEE